MTDEEKRAKRAAYMREWYRRHPEKMNDSRRKKLDEYRRKDRERYAESRAEVLERRRLERLANPEKFRQRDREQGQKYKERKKRRRREHAAELRILNPRPPRQLNEAAFAVESEESAYWTGFLMADGCVHKTTVRLSLSAEDAEHVRKFARFLACPRLPRIAQYASSFRSGPTASFSVGSRRLVQDLTARGVCPQKTHIARVIGLGYNRHFWRGAIDGDGFVMVKRSGKQLGYPTVGLCGARSLVEQFNAFSESVLGRPGRVVPMKSIFAVTFPGTWAVRLIRELYEGCTVALDRKLIRANEAMKWVPRRTFPSSFQTVAST